MQDKPLPIRLFASAIEHPTKTNKIDAAVSVEDPATTNPRVTPKKSAKSHPYQEHSFHGRLAKKIRTQDLNRLHILS